MFTYAAVGGTNEVYTRVSQRLYYNNVLLHSGVEYESTKDWKNCIHV